MKVMREVLEVVCFSDGYCHCPIHLPPQDRRRPVRASAKTAKQRNSPPQHNLHPGVEIIHVSYNGPNGHTRAMRILKVNNRFVGPQGETYATLPTSDELVSRYTLPQSETPSVEKPQ